MKAENLRETIYEHLPGLNEILENEKVPIHQRTFRAAYLFVELAVVAPDKERRELIGSEVFRETIVPIVSDWYWEKYGNLCRDQRDRDLSGILASYAQPLLIKFPQTLSRIEIEGESAWLSFPDSLRDEESINDMAGNVLDLTRLEPASATALKVEASAVVGFSRSINLNLMSKDGLDGEAFSLAQTIWPHFEKAIRDILTLTPEGAAAACWDLHLAVEKSYKVLIRSKKSGATPFGHDLKELHKGAVACGFSIDGTLMKRLPKDKKAISLRYAETLVDTSTAVGHYKTALELVDQITRELPRKMKFNNGSFLIKMAPWAK